MFSENIIEGNNLFIAPGARVLGNVIPGRNVNIWYNAVIRADSGEVRIGDDTNIQDNCVIHVEPDAPVSIGKGCTIGHSAIIHGCTIDDNTLIGMGAIVMNYAKIGKNCIVAAGALVTEHSVIPDNSLVIGMPGKVRRATTPEEVEINRMSAKLYIEEAQRHKEGEFE